jgi:deoxyribonuclease-4
VDRHEHIGKGCIGLGPFRRLLNDPRFAKLPMLLETPKVDSPQTRKASDIDPLDQMNLDVLRGLLQPPKTSATKR